MFRSFQLSRRIATRELAPGSVELRQRAGEPDFVVTPAPLDEPHEPALDAHPPSLAPAEGDEGAAARINLRLPEQLKAGVEQAASRERLSVNAWLVRVAAAALARDDPDRRPPPAAAWRADRRGLRRLGALSARSSASTPPPDFEPDLAGGHRMPIFDTPEPISASIDVAVGDVRISAGDRAATVVDVRPSDVSSDQDLKAAELTHVE